MAENTSKVRGDQVSGKSLSANPEVTEYRENLEEQVSTDNEDIRARIAELETERIRKATWEIQAILDKYGVVLQAVAVIPASRINVVSKLNS